MSFLCCCVKTKPPKANETYRNFQAELDLKNRLINELTQENKVANAELLEMKKDLEESRKSNQQLKEIITGKDDVLVKDAKRIEGQEKEIEETQKKLREKEEKIAELEEKLRVETPINPTPENNTKASMRRRAAVRPVKIATNVQVKKTEKNPEQKKFLYEAMTSNDFFKHLSSVQIYMMVDYMVFKSFSQNDTLIEEDEDGDGLYVLHSGECQVSKGIKNLKVMTPGVVFGELAIIHNCKRTATIKALESVEAWYLEREVFQYVMVEAVKAHYQEIAELVQGTPLQKLGKDKFERIAGAVEKEEFRHGDYIVRQGEIGHTFYIIKDGEVDITRTQEDLKGRSETWIRTLHTGSFFGEKALQKHGDLRTANVIAKTESVSCYTLDEKHFNQLIGNTASMLWQQTHKRSLEGLLKVPSDDTPRPSTQSTASFSDRPFENVELKEFEFIATLGSGGFGKVELVRHADNDQTYALKCMKKIHIVETKQEEHVHSEKNIMLRCHSSFVVRLYRTYKNNRYVYMLMEACLGGELWTHLRDSSKFSDSRAKFYTACVVEALDYLCRKKIVYRDLKPENLLLDKKGYVKLVDFGFAKELQNGERTWTFCGTPQYVPPEIILNQGHDIASDYWALGILMFEFLTGNPPFDAVDPMRTYRLALRGIDAVEFPVFIKKPAQNLIRRLCREKPTERLGNLKGGINDIRLHKWFTGFDWKGLKNGTLPAEYIPVINGPTDVRNFEKFDRVNEKVPSETSGWDKDF